MKYIIFGSGYHGRLALRKLKKNKSKKNLINFIDNNKIKHNKICLGSKIFQIKKINFDKIVMCGRNIEEQIIQIKKFNIPKEKFLFLGKTQIRPNKKLIFKRSKIFNQMLEELIPEFDKMKIDYCMDYSGLLPLMRNEAYGELSDIEISINLNHIPKVIKILKNNSTFKTQYIFVKNKKYIKKNNKRFNRIVLYSKYKGKDIELPHIDLIIKKINRKNTFNMFLQNSFPIKFWKNKSFKRYKKLHLNIPNYCKEYLKTLYGKNWKKKSEHWGLKNGKFKSMTLNNYYKILNTKIC